MAAVLTPHPIHPTGTTTGRPSLTVIDGGRSAMGLRSRRMYRRRRLVALLTIAVVGWLVVSSVLSIGSAMLSSTAPSSAEVVSSSPVPSSAITDGGAAASRYVVRPGDTLWSIAKSLHVDGDIRDTMAQLAETNGDGLLRSGQVLIIPEDLRA